MPEHIVHEFIKDAAMLKRIASTSCRIIMVIGSSDSGKTTLVEDLADMLSKKERLAVVDLDMGQSHIGPPTTMGWGKVHGGFIGWGQIRTEGFYFTGTLSPPSNLLPCLTGAKLITDEALRACPKALIDTSGFVIGPVGRIYKQYKIELLRPDVVLAIAKGDELGELIRSFMFRKKPVIYKIGVPASVLSKSIDKRSGYRGDMFRDYFRGSRLIKVSPKKTGIMFTGGEDKKALSGRVVSFRDDIGRDVALGVIERIELKTDTFLIRSPINEKKRFSTLMIGSAVME